MSTDDLDPNLEASLRSGLTDLAEAVFPDEHFAELLAESSASEAAPSIDDDGDSPPTDHNDMHGQRRAVQEDNNVTTTQMPGTDSESDSDDLPASARTVGELDARRKSRVSRSWRPLAAAAAAVVLIAGTVTWLTGNNDSYTIEDRSAVASRLDDTVVTRFANPPLPSPKTRAVSLGERVLVVGDDGTGNAIYDPATENWAPVADAPRGQPVDTEWTGTQLIGFFSEDSNSANEARSPMWLSYTPELDTWADLAAPEPVLAAGHRLSSHLDQLEFVDDEVFIPGFSPWFYNTRDGIWRAGSPTPTLEQETVSHPASAATGWLADSRLFLTTALSRRADSASQWLVLIYDVAADEWTTADYPGSGSPSAPFVEAGGKALHLGWRDDRFVVTVFDPLTGEGREVWQAKKSAHQIGRLYHVDGAFVVVLSDVDRSILLLNVPYDPASGAVGETIASEWEWPGDQSGWSEHTLVGSAVVITGASGTAAYDIETAKLVDLGDTVSLVVRNDGSHVVVDDDTLVVWNGRGVLVPGGVIELGG